MPSLRRWPGGPCPHFGLFKTLFFEHHVTTKQQIMMEKGIIMVKRNSCLTFFDSLQNCWQSTAEHKWTSYQHAFTVVSRKEDLRKLFNTKKVQNLESFLIKLFILGMQENH